MSHATTPEPLAVPALYQTVISHVRTSPAAHSLSSRSTSWLVDLADLPRPAWPLSYLARFDARDHIGDPDRGIAENLADLLADHGVAREEHARVLMLTNARSWGHNFNPLTVFWCLDQQGEVRAVVAEVHNTYGQAHAYVLRTDNDGRARTDKTFYVSPFNAVEGYYQLSLPLPTESLSLTVTLHREHERPFVATVRGHGRPATTGSFLRAALRRPSPTRLIALSIRWHGIRLWLKGLRIVPRPSPPATFAPARACDIESLR